MRGTLSCISADVEEYLETINAPKNAEIPQDSAYILFGITFGMKGSPSKQLRRKGNTVHFKQKPDFMIRFDSSNEDGHGNTVRERSISFVTGENPFATFNSSIIDYITLMPSMTHTAVTPSDDNERRGIPYLTDEVSPSNLNYDYLGDNIDYLIDQISNDAETQRSLTLAPDHQVEYYLAQPSPQLSTSESSVPSKPLQVEIRTPPASSSKKSPHHTRRGRRNTPKEALDERMESLCFLNIFDNYTPAQIERLDEIYCMHGGKIPSRRILRELSSDSMISQTRIRKWFMKRSSEKIAVPVDQKLLKIATLPMPTRMIENDSSKDCINDENHLFDQLSKRIEQFEVALNETRRQRDELLARISH